MNIRTELLAVGVRLLAEHTTLVRKPTGFEAAFDSFLNDGETYDRRMAKNLDGELQRGVDAIKRANINRKFKKITTMV